MKTDPYGNVHGVDMTGWVPARLIYEKTVQENPQYRLPSSGVGFSLFLHDTRDQLHDAGLIVRTRSKTWLCPPAQLPKAILDLASGIKLKPLKGRTGKLSARMAAAAIERKRGAERRASP